MFSQMFVCLSTGGWGQGGVGYLWSQFPSSSLVPGSFQRVGYLWSQVPSKRLRVSLVPGPFWRVGYLGGAGRVSAGRASRRVAYTKGARISGGRV